MFKYIKRDFPSSLVLYYVALTLCWVFSLASGMPFFGGFIGGVLVVALSGFILDNNGPAADNIVSGLIGVLPIKQVRVRGAVNVQSGATSKLSAIFHVLLIIISVILIPNLLNMISLSVLATVLFVVYLIVQYFSETTRNKNIENNLISGRATIHNPQDYIEIFKLDIKRISV